MKLSYETVDELRASPEWRVRAKTVRRKIASYRKERPDVFVPDVPISATEPVTGNLWYHLGLRAYINMLRRFKRVLEPSVRDTAETWRGQRFEDLWDEMFAYQKTSRAEWDRRDQQDRVRTEHLRLVNIFRGFYLTEPIALIGAGPPGEQVFGLVSNGLHRLFVAQVLGTIDTLPAIVSLRTEGPLQEPICERELYLDDELPKSD